MIKQPYSISIPMYIEKALHIFQRPEMYKLHHVFQQIMPLTNG